MRNLNWRSALRRASVFTLVWLGIVYITSVLWPQTLGIEVPEELPFLALNAVFFFCIFAVFSAFSERLKERHQHQQKQKSAAKDTQPEEEGGPLKGQPNPNTSRKKAARKRR